MPKVRMPNGQVVDLPDNPTEEQRAQIMAMVPSVGEKLRPRTGMETAKMVATEVPKVVGSAIYGGLSAFPRLWNMAGEGIESLIPGDRKPTYQSMIDESNATVRGADQSIQQALEPSTQGGKTAATIGEYTVGGMVGPGGLTNPIKSAIIGTGAGVGSEAGADLLGDNMLSRVAGGLAGGGLAGMSTNAFTNRASLARETLADARPKDLQTAQQRMKAAEAEGRQLNLSQAMPRASNIDSVVEALANSPTGVKITNMLRNQPGAVAMEAENAVGALPGAVRSPQNLANEASETFTRAIADARQQAGEAWRAFAPNGAAFEVNTIAQFDNALANLAKQHPNTARGDMIEQVRANLKLKEVAEDATPTILDSRGMPLNPKDTGPKYITDALQLKDAVDDILQNYGARALNSPSLTGTLQKQAQDIREMFKGLIEKGAPDLKKANEAYEAYMTAVVEPMKKSVIGRIAGRAGAKNDVEATRGKLFQIFDAGTTPGTKSSEILTMERTYRNAGNPEGFQDAVKSWLVGKLDKALASTDNREPDNIASLLRQVWGNPRQADSASKGLQDMLIGMARSQGVADQDAYLRGFHQFMEYVADASRRPASVSGMSTADVKQIAGDAVTNRLGRFSIMTPIRQPALAWSTFLQNDALKAMDELLTSSAGVDTLIKLGKTQPYSQKALTAMSTFLGTNASIQANSNAEGLQQSNTPEN